MQLSQHQLDAYERDGMLVFPELFSEAEVAVLRREVERLQDVEDECIFREGEANTPKIVFKMDDPRSPTFSAPFQALFATLDSLFDAHLISFDTDGTIMLGNKIPEHEQRCLGVDTAMRLRQLPSAEAESYLREHRTRLDA